MKSIILGLGLAVGLALVGCREERNDKALGATPDDVANPHAVNPSSPNPESTTPSPGVNIGDTHGSQAPGGAIGTPPQSGTSDVYGTPSAGQMNGADQGQQGQGTTSQGAVDQTGRNPSPVGTSTSSSSQRGSQSNGSVNKGDQSNSSKGDSHNQSGSSQSNAHDGGGSQMNPQQGASPK